MNHFIAIGAVLAFALMTTTPVAALGFDGHRPGAGNGGTGGGATPGATILRSPAFDPELLPLCRLVARL